MAIDDQAQGDGDHLNQVYLREQHKSMSDQDHTKLIEMRFTNEKNDGVPIERMLIPNTFWTIAAYQMDQDNLLLVTKHQTFILDSKEWVVLSETDHKGLIHRSIMT